MAPVTYADPTTDLEVVRVNARLLLGKALSETLVPACLSEAVEVADVRWRAHTKRSNRTVERHVTAAIIAMLGSGWAQKAIAERLGVSAATVADTKVFLDLYRTRQTP